MTPRRQLSPKQSGHEAQGPHSSLLFVKNNPYPAHGSLSLLAYLIGRSMSWSVRRQPRLVLAMRPGSSAPDSIMMVTRSSSIEAQPTRSAPTLATVVSITSRREGLAVASRPEPSLPCTAGRIAAYEPFVAGRQSLGCAIHPACASVPF